MTSTVEAWAHHYSVLRPKCVHTVKLPAAASMTTPEGQLLLYSSSTHTTIRCGEMSPPRALSRDRMKGSKRRRMHYRRGGGRGQTFGIRSREGWQAGRGRNQGGCEGEDIRSSDWVHTHVSLSPTPSVPALPCRAAYSSGQHVHACTDSRRNSVQETARLSSFRLTAAHLEVSRGRRSPPTRI